MNKLTIRLAVAVIVLLGLVFLLLGHNTHLSREFKRERENLRQITQEGARELVLSRAEFSRMNTQWKRQLDSTLKAHRIALSRVERAVVIRTQYRDTGSVQIIYRPQQPDPVDSTRVRIPFAYANKCWGVNGYIETRDSQARVQLSERTASVQASLVVTRDRVLGFLWWKQKKEFQAYSDCGVIDITSINFRRRGK